MGKRVRGMNTGLWRKNLKGSNSYEYMSRRNDNTKKGSQVTTSRMGVCGQELFINCR
jgi:hypothetical protein